MPKSNLSEALDAAHEAYLEDPTTEDSFYQTLYAFVRGRTQEEDEVQEAVIRVWQNLPSYNGSAKFSTWAYEVATHSLQYDRRKQSSRNEVSLEELVEKYGDGILGASSLPSPERTVIVDSALQALTKRQREVVGLMREGYTEEQVGEDLHITQQTVHEIWEAALERLREGAQ